MNVLFSEFEPHHSLSPFVESYWYGEFNIEGDTNFSQKVMPNGCIELIIHLTDDHCALNKAGDSFDSSPPFTLMGIYPKPYIVKFSALVNVFGIRVFPDGFKNIFGVPPSKFLSTFEDGIGVLGKKLEILSLKIRESENHNDRITLANKFLAKYLLKHRQEYDNSHLAMQFIRDRQGLINFDDLKEKIPLGLRQLQRDFKNNYGFKITDYIRISRLNQINKYMLNGHSSLTALAYELQFTDQSHFIKEFKNYSGLAPRRFLKNKEHYIVNAV